MKKKKKTKPKKTKKIISKKMKKAKTSSKKSSTEKSKKSKISKFTKKVPEEKAFILITGGKIYSIRELADELAGMDDSTYYYHTGQGRNDFYNWVKEVFKMEELAETLLNALSREEAAIQIYKYILDNL